MISFIIIGRNEGWKLTKCLESVFKTIKENCLTDSEVVYVDSKSTDDSISRAKKFPKVKIFKITGQYNAAIARNIGAKEANGDIFCFVDGDMELYSKFIKTVIKDNKLIHPRVCGDLVNKFYNENWHYLETRNSLFGMRNKRVYSAEQGGYFFINKSLWEKVDGMKNYMLKSQDIDFGIRCSINGYLLLRIPEPMVNHHTQSHRLNYNKWNRLKKGFGLYSTSVYFRENLFNKYIWKWFIRKEYSLLSLLLAILSSLFLNSFNPFIIYFLVIIIRSVKRNNSFIMFTNDFIYFAIRDVISLLGIFVFFPTKNIDLEYKELN